MVRGWGWRMEAYYFHPLSSDLVGIVRCFLSLKSPLSLLLNAMHAEAILGRRTFLFMKGTCNLNPCLLFFFFSLDEESIGQCLLAKLMWFRAIRRHSNQIKLLPAQIKLPEQRNAFYASGPLHVLSPLCLERVSLSLHYSSSLGWLKSSFRPHLFREWFRDSTHPPTIRWLVCALAVHLHTSMLPCFSCLHNSDSSFTIFLSQLFCNLSENFACLSHCGVCA